MASITWIQFSVQLWVKQEVQKESQAAENKSWPKDELLTYKKQVKQTSLIKRSVSALEMNTFKDETTLNMSANFKTSMKELKVMKKWISELEVETEIRKSFPTKYLLNQASTVVIFGQHRQMYQ
ncbi:hypothetical protein TURU_158928 [Turdus rufiventris]|nr:hypothetical protein TURU_158928 [Turdus rufiventris]